MMPGRVERSYKSLPLVGQFSPLILSALLSGMLLASDLLHPPHAEADTGSWSKPVMVSRGERGWFPDVAADDAGRVHVVWSGSSDFEVRDDAPLYYAGWDGQAWTQPNDIALIAPRTATTRSALAVDKAGRVHLLYRGFGRLVKDDSVKEGIWHAASDGAGAKSLSSWSAPQQISRRASTYFPEIAVDSRGVIHAIWTEWDGLCCYAIYYTNSADGGATWSERTILDGSNAVYSFRAQLKIDAQDRLHAVWELTDPRASWAERTTRGVVYALSNDGGGTWTKTKFAPPDDLYYYPFDSTPRPGPQQPTVGIDGNGNILIIFREPDSDQVYYQHSTDGANWSVPAPLPGVRVGISRPFDVYDTVTDSAGHVHLVMVAYPSDSDRMSLLHTEWNGQSWTMPSVIASSPPYPEYPRLALSEGNRLHVVWFYGDVATTNRAPIGIWYSTAQTTAPQKANPPAPAASGAMTAMTPVPTPASPLPAAPNRSPAERREPAVAVDGSDSSSGWLSDLRQRRSFALVAGMIPVVPLLAVVLLRKLGLLEVIGRTLWPGPVDGVNGNRS